LKLYVNAKTLVSDERGQDLIEYALVAAVIAVGCVATMGTVANSIKALFNSVTASLS
jgi:pilus assembly protein Flp/PilA